MPGKPRACSSDAVKVSPACYVVHQARSASSNGAAKKKTVAAERNRYCRQAVCAPAERVKGRTSPREACTLLHTVRLPCPLRVRPGGWSPRRLILILTGRRFLSVRHPIPPLPLCSFAARRAEPAAAGGGQWTIHSFAVWRRFDPRPEPACTVADRFLCCSSPQILPASDTKTPCLSRRTRSPIPPAPPL
jgi:hypothetical protein